MTTEQRQRTDSDGHVVFLKTKFVCYSFSITIASSQPFSHNNNNNNNILHQIIVDMRDEMVASDCDKEVKKIKQPLVGWTHLVVNFTNILRATFAPIFF